MAAITLVSSPSHFESIIQNNTLVVADFYADWCGPCKTIAPLFEKLSRQANEQIKMVFTKIDTEKQTQITSAYGITAMPTFLFFRNGQEVNRVTGADPKKLTDAVKNLGSSDGGQASSSSADSNWRGAEIPKGHGDITEQVDIKNLDILNLDNEFGRARDLFEGTAPTALDAKGKGKDKAEDSKKDWIESDTDEQLMMFVPFNSTLKIHTLQFTSLPPTESNDPETPMRPKKIHLFTNRAHNLGFEEAEGVQPSQVVDLAAEDWNNETGTASIPLRYVRFQNVTSLVIFVVSGDGDAEKVRIDRIRLIGDTGEKRDMGKLEKVGGDDG